MTRIRFLNELYHHLYGLTQDQVEQHLTYYAEILADRIEDGVSEEDAVASMEDVETIARRIMEEEGLPYTPPGQRPPVPPSYPDASRLGGGGFKHAYKITKRWNWGKIARTALWAVAIFAVFFGVVAQIAERSWRRSSSAAGTAASESLPELSADTSSAFSTALVEDHGWAYEYADMPYAQGYAYSGVKNVFDVDRVRGINIEWASGMVCIFSHGGENLLVQEFSGDELSERTKMMVTYEDDLLTITYRDGTGLGNVKNSKWLNIMIPEGLMGEINIQTTSAGVQLAQLELDTLRVETVSGDITCDECYAQTAELTTVSGDLVLNHPSISQMAISTASGYMTGDLQCTDLSANSVSGDISMSLYNSVEKLKLNTISGDIWTSVEDASIRSIGAESVSGDISLSIPWNMGYTLDLASVSGDVELANFEGDWPVGTSGRYVQGSGWCQIAVNTTSGDLYIY